jgi:hypothetical protein
VVVFQQGTIKKLLENDKLAPAFKIFGVKYIVGYPESLSKKILAKVNVVNISSSDVDNADNNNEEVADESYTVKNWIMNLIK